ncbi:MAG: hypothetical protein RR336_05335, partial [Oscillospiraceae bacterium]
CFGLLFFNPNLSLPHGKKVCEKSVSSFSGKRQILQATKKTARSAGGFFPPALLIFEIDVRVVWNSEKTVS